MRDGAGRFALTWFFGVAAAVVAAVVFPSALESDSEEAGGGLILVGVLMPIVFATVLRQLGGEGRLLRDAAMAAAGYGFALGIIAAGMRTIDASRGYTFFVVAGYFFVVGWVTALLVVGARKLIRRALRFVLRRPAEGHNE